MNLDFLSNYNGLAGLPVLITLIIILAGITICAKKGIISFNGKGLRLGQDLATRNLIQAQMEYAKAKVDGVVSQLPSHLDTYHTKYVLGTVTLEIYRAIIFNNMRESKAYLESKQELIYWTVMKRVTDDYFKTEEFKRFCYEFVDDLFRDLIRMKEER